MLYKYITENNLYDKQNYMYSEYGGIAFLDSYLLSRREFLNRLGVTRELHGDFLTGKSSTEKRLKEILRKFRTGQEDEESIELVNLYTKSFEVRKRLYTEYDEKCKPVENAIFENYEVYLLFADCLMHVYKKTGCLKYLSCLLKVTDTLLSVSDKLELEIKEYMAWIVSAEIKAFFDLSAKLGIDLEDRI